MLSVREIESSDIELIADYWLNSDPDFLIGMGVDLSKLPLREELTTMISRQLSEPYESKDSYALIWLVDGEPSGHSNVNAIRFGVDAYMHLHMWHSENRRQGIGTELLKLSLPYFFYKLQLQMLFCEPYAVNPAPGKTLKKVGFEFEKEYITTPGSLSFEQKVQRWRMSRKQFENLKGHI